MIEKGLPTGPFTPRPDKLAYMWRDLERRAHVVLNNSDDTFSINVTTRDAFAEDRILYGGESSSCTNRSNLDNCDDTAIASCG